MKHVFARVLSTVLITFLTVCLSLAPVDCLTSSYALADDAVPQEMGLAECFSKTVTSGQNIHNCDSALDKARSELLSIDLADRGRCMNIQSRVERATGEEYLRLYEVRECYLYVDNPFWEGVYYGSADSPCAYDDLYNEYVCQ